MAIKVMDLFCGTGGFMQGFLESERDFELLYAIDKDRWASETAKANHTNARIDTGDIRKVNLDTLSKDLGIKEVDLIIGGPPCQGFSSLRPNRSSEEEDDRNNLYLSFRNFIGKFRPKIFVMENVVGLLTHDKGATLRKVEGALSAAGYTIDWRIVNAAGFGVPQKRERLIMIGARDNAQIAFPEPTHFFEGKVIGYHEKKRMLLSDGTLPAITVMEAIGDLPKLSSGEEATRYTSEPANAYQKERRKRASSLTLHKAAKHSEKMLNVIKYAGPSIKSLPPGLVTSGFSSCYSRLDANQPGTTITVKFQSPASSRCIHPIQDRTLTPREAARLQSFSDDYIFRGPMTNVASQLGNAVPPLLGKAFGNELAKYL